jgi:hypothetical protein
MLIKINNLIINTANIVSAHFAPATNTLQESLTMIFVNRREVTNATGTIPLKGDEAVLVWEALCQEAKDVLPA